MLIEKCLCGGITWTQIALGQWARHLCIASCLNCATKWLVSSQSPADIEDWYASGAYHDDSSRHAGVVPYEKRYETDLAAAVKRIKRYRERIPTLDYRETLERIPLVLLDVGAANGAFVDAAIAEGFDAVGIDPDERFAREGRVLRGTIESAPLRPAGFDLITYHDVLEHLPDPRAELRAAAERLVYGGHVIVEVPDVHVDAGEKHYKREHLWYFSLRALADLVHDVGLQVRAFDFPIPGKMAVFACRPR